MAPASLLVVCLVLALSTQALVSSTNRKWPRRNRRKNKTELTKENGEGGQSALCYKWKPRSLTVHPFQNGTVSVRWHPAFTKSGFVIMLWRDDQPNLSYEKRYPSYKSRIPVTEFVFTNVSAGKYRAKMAPTGCVDCPDHELSDCIPTPTNSEQVTISETKAVPDDPPMEIVRSHLVQSDTGDVYVVTGVCAVVVIVVLLITVTFCIIRGGRRKMLVSSFEEADTDKIPNQEADTCGRIVLLYAKDHDHHVAAVHCLARVLQALLPVEVVLDGQQASWWTHTTPLDTTNSKVMVILSESLWQLSVEESGAVSRCGQDINADNEPMVLRYLRQQHFPLDQVIPLSFGYKHGSYNLTVLKELFKQKCCHLTVEQNGVRTCILSELCSLLGVNSPCSDLVVIDYIQLFLRNVEKMDDHMRQFENCWEQDEDSTSDMSSVTARQRLDIDTDTFTLATQSTGTSYITVDMLCKKCWTSDSVRMSCVSADSTGSPNDCQQYISDASCWTLNIPEKDQRPSIPDYSETRALLPKRDISVSVHSHQTPGYNPADCATADPNDFGREC